MIELKNLQKQYKNTTPLKGVNAVINNGDVISVIGPSGTGKSTLLRCINMLERPTGGQILLDGEDITAPKYDVTKARRKMGMVFQSFNLFGHLTVIENLMVPQMDILQKSKQEAYETGVRLLERVGLAGRELDYPEQLSGGQKQRVAIARTLSMDPDVILLDEPTSALDPTMVGEVQAVIRDLASMNKTMLIVTHEMSFARAICNRVFYMDEGGIYEEGTPEEIFDHPKKERTRRFIRRLKVLEISFTSGKTDFPGAVTEIDRYCFKNDISPRLKNRLSLVFEELLQQILMPKLGNPGVKVTMEYSEEEKQVEVMVRYDGGPFDPRETDNLLSLKLLESTASGIRYTTETGEEFPNCFRCLITESGGSSSGS